MAARSSTLRASRSLGLSLRMWLAPLALLALAGALVLHNLAIDPPFWFDEGYKTNAARTIAEHGQYATLTADGFIPFDPGISGGPADIGAIALSFKLLGISVLSARLPAAVYAMIATLLIYALVARLHGRRAGALAALAVLAAPALEGSGLVALGRQALAEVPALAWTTAGLLLLAGAWRRDSRGLEALAGVLLGVGILSRQQWAMALLPALTLALAWRARPGQPGRLRRLLRSSVPLIAMSGLVLLWKAIEVVGTPTALRAENALMAAEATRSNLLTASFGRMLDAPGWLATGLMTLGVIAGIIRLTQLMRIRDTARPAFGVLLLLTTFVFCHGAWYALLSVGWTRYAFPGIVFALVLIAVAFQHTVAQRVKLAGNALAAILAIGALTSLFAIPPAQNAAVERIAAAVRANVPPGALIETWEWEVATFVGPERFHLPHQRYLFQAIRQRDAHNNEFDLNYDTLQRDPQYLLVGAFGAWTRIYDESVIERCFTPIATEAQYILYQRSGCAKPQS